MSPISSRKIVPAVSELEPADAALDGVRERALLVPEELRLQEVVLNRSAVDLDERAVLARASLVNRVGNELFARPRFAVDVHGGVRRRDLVDHRKHALHRLRLTDDAREGTRLFAHHVAQVLVLALQSSRPLVALLNGERALDLGLEQVDGERLLDEVERARLHRRHSRLHRAVRRDDHRQGVRVRLANRLEYSEAVDRLHLQVGDDEIDRLLVGSIDVDALLSAGGGDRPMPHAMHDRRDAFANRIVVVDYQDRRHRRSSSYPIISPS